MGWEKFIKSSSEFRYVFLSVGAWFFIKDEKDTFATIKLQKNLKFTGVIQ